MQVQFPSDSKHHNIGRCPGRKQNSSASILIPSSLKKRQIIRLHQKEQETGRSTRKPNPSLTTHRISPDLCEVHAQLPTILAVKDVVSVFEAAYSRSQKQRLISQTEESSSLQRRFSVMKWRLGLDQLEQTTRRSPASLKFPWEKRLKCNWPSS